MASPSEATLISKLESSDLSKIHSLFSDYLLPFRDLTSPKRKPSKATALNLTRSLAKQFLPFLNRCLSILPKRLAVPSDLENKQFGFELFDVYKLCLNCLESVSSQLSCKPYVVYLQRLRLVHCLAAWGRHGEAEREALWVLERLRGVDLGVKEWGKFLPGAVENGDGELAALLVEVVAMVVKCLATGQSKDERDYGKVVDLVEEVRPWFRVLDAKEYEKFHRVFVTYLGRSTLFLFAELNQFNGHVVHKFLVTTLTEYAKSSAKNQFYKFSRQLCSSLFSLQENEPSLTAKILFCILDFVAHECKGDGEAYEIEFLQLVSYCANKCQAAHAVFSLDLAAHLNDLSCHFCQVMTPSDMILRLYVVGLSFIDYDANSKDGGIMSSGTKDVHAAMDMLDGGEGQHNLATLIRSLQNYFQVSCKDHWESSSVGHDDGASQSGSQLVSNHGASIISSPKSRKAYLPAYLNALKFLCQPLAELVHFEKKQIVLQNGSPFSTRLCGVQDTFHQLCEVILFLYSGRSERKGDDLDDNKIILSVAVAALILSIRTKLNLQKSLHLVKHIIGSRWIQPQGLKYLFASLYNVGVLLFRNNLVKEASKALKLSCLASWTCVTLLCQMFVDKSNTSSDDVSEDAIVDFVVEVCTRSASLLDVQYQCDSRKVKKTIIYCLENWSHAGKLFRGLPKPLPLVKQWVKIRCRLLKNKDIEDNAPSLYHMLTSSSKVSKEAIGIILEQELLACEELNAMSPQLCLSMQTEIMDYLLQFVYVTRDSVLQKSRILLRRGRAFRACGIEGLKSCIQCLSEAISIINDMYVETCSGQSLVCHQLAVAYCLRALCTQEAEPNSQEVLQDISAALKLWLSIRVQDYGLTNNVPGIVSENVMLLLYNVIDLLGMKGSMEFHHDIYRLMIRLFKWKNVPLEKYLFILWESRRFSHALCVSPIDEAFITHLSEHCGEPCKSIDFWMRCLNISQTSLLAFQQIFSFFSTKPLCGSYKHENCLQSDIVAGIKETVLELTSRVPTTSNSLFLAGYLCYDLCERLISNGCLLEALSFAKEAHRLRTKLFQEKFIYSVEHQVGLYDEARNRPQKLTYLLRDLQLLKSVATEVWSFDTISWDMERFYLSPWKILQCYLESTLQVGIIQEIIGNSAEAETFLLWGKEISRSQSLSLFAVSFSSILGKLYCKKRLWDLSERELQSAKNILADDKAVFSCHKCRLLLEVAVDQQLGDLSRNHVDDSAGNDGSPEMLSCAENWYKSALDTLNRCDWKNSVSCPEEASPEITTVKEDCKNVECVDHPAKLLPDTRNTVSKKEGAKAKMEAKKCRKAKNTTRSSLREQASIPEHNFRITRSRCQSSQNQQLTICAEKQVDLSQQSKGHSGSNFPSLINDESDLGVKSSTIDKGSEGMCICDKLNCWFCLAKEVVASGLVPDFIHMKWEFIRRRLLLRVLTGIGKCLGDTDQIHEKHEIIMQSISVLVIRNPFCKTHVFVSTNFLLDLVGKEFCRDVFAIERASILYNLCWLSLKSYFHGESRENCCGLSNIQLPKVVSWLKLAFVLCREVPILFQKVSRLLAALYIISASNGDFPSSFSGKVLSESHWASYFHQASLGTHLNYQFSSIMRERFKAERYEDTKDLHVTSSACIIEEKWKIPRSAPDSVQDLEQFVADFFARLPSTTIICISLLGGVYVSLFHELLNYPSCVGAWMLMSRMRSKSQPIVILLPVDAILNDLNDANSGSLEFPGSKDPSKHWHCPWGSTVVDEVAPTFKLILEENYKSSSSFPLEDTKENRSLWWKWREKLDYQLSNFLRNLEDSWLGPWRYMLLGGWSKHGILDRVHKMLMRDLKTKCKMDVNESFLNVFIGGARHAFEEETNVEWLCSKKGCYVGKAGFCNEENIEKLPNTSNGIKKLTELAFQLIQEAIDELEEEENVKRESIILVLDSEVQMLPWENLPVLRNQEVYRMPSIGSILVTLERSRCHLQQKNGGIVTTFPVIDPLDAFYLLNPSGDLSGTQLEFEKWFRDHNLKGKAGSAPMAEELALALKSHDLFIYLGHGSGAQYIPANEIQKLENCAATLLMGCSSGCLLLNGCYIPQGTPISYLLAGSPVIVANLWEVTDKDIDRFGRAMLDAWLTERSVVECDLVAKELETLNIRTRKGNAKKKLSKKKLSEACDNGSCNDACDHRPKVGSFMSQAREACTLPFLIGASPVCYGVPTGIWRKDL
ncbi:separase isoform X2 [Tripterygium wilfordii]|uniref:separase isoform X2 n=1 Tax=Tripterygium wilfordii TaxID=458696 RepID=UPI0018F85379|nr:separase isoform X2 [Tripterygium wilfordii]